MLIYLRLYISARRQPGDSLWSSSQVLPTATCQNFQSYCV